MLTSKQQLRAIINDMFSTAQDENSSLDTEFCVNYLTDKGVLAPEFKVDDTVYIVGYNNEIWESTIYAVEYSGYGFEYSYGKLGDRKMPDCLVGVLFFKTRSEAEQAVRYRECL